MQTHEDINCACRYQYAAKVQAEIDVENHDSPPFAVGPRHQILDIKKNKTVFFDKEGILRDFSENVLQDDADVVMVFL